MAKLIYVSNVSLGKQRPRSYSTTLDAVSTPKTRLERHFEPASVRDLKASATSDLTVGGAHLAAQALEAGLVNECQTL